MTRSSHNWKTRPGGFDVLHTSRVFSSSSDYGIPDLLEQSFDSLPDNFSLRPYRTKNADSDSDLCHFYLDDYRFETVWNRVRPAVDHVRGYWGALTPDFSLYPSWPKAAQVWNTYRSRWIGRLWQEAGINVIPTLNWSDASSFEFCLDGIPKDQIVSIASSDLRKPEVERRFREGVSRAVDQLEPRMMIIYGKTPFDPGCKYIEVDPDWKRCTKH